MADGLISRIYSNFRGCDFRGEEINLVRSPDCLNVWKDYKEIESIRTRPDMSLLESFEDTIYGIFFFSYKVFGEDTEVDAMIVHSGDTLYKVEDGERIIIYEGAKRARSDAFVHGRWWYFKDGNNYIRYNGYDTQPLVGYVPTTSIARKPAGGGTVYEDVNLLSPRRINTFLGDGVSKEYHLDAQDLNEKAYPYITVNGKHVYEGFTVDYVKGIVTFDEAPPAPLTDGQDNVSIEFNKEDQDYKIKQCTLLQVFDNRVFFSGNPYYPNMIWHSSLNDPSYCSDLDYYEEGLDSSMVKGLVAGNNVLWVFKEQSQADTTVFYHTPTIDSEYGKIYPSTHSSVSTGCVGKAINFNDDIVFFSERGMEGVSGDITTEQALGHRSSLVDRKLTTEPGYKDMVLAEWEGYLLVFIGKKVYLADSRATFNNENHVEYDWFYWELKKAVTCAKVKDDVLYLGTEDGVYTLTNFDSEIESYWVTPKDKFKYPHRLKTTNKRGCVAEASGDISVYVKTENTDFELVGEHKNVTDYFVSRIKRKKWKDIQLKFHSNTRFSLETITLEAFTGGYIKR